MYSYSYNVTCGFIAKRNLPRSCFSSGAELPRGDLFWNGICRVLDNAGTELGASSFWNVMSRVLIPSGTEFAAC
jgi:hypothetical protein